MKAATINDNSYILQRYVDKRDSTFGTLCAGIFLCVGIFVTIVCLIRFEVARRYYFEFLAPLVFSALTLIFHGLYKHIPKNIAVTLILFLLFIRMVINPLLSCLSNYSTEAIIKQVDKNTTPAILLVCYEAIAVFVVMHRQLLRKNLARQMGIKQRYNKKGEKIFLTIFLLALGVLLLCIIIAPQVLLCYRPISLVFKDRSLSWEAVNVILTYGQSFFKRIFLIIGIYLIRILVVPSSAILIVLLLKKQRKKKAVFRLLSFLACFTPMLFISDVIADGFINSFALILYRASILNKNNKKILLIMAVACIAVFAWWTWRFIVVTGGKDFAAFFADRLNAYCSGINIVSGSFNMPNNLVLKLKLFIYDIIYGIPFHSTLFPFEHHHLPFLFNESNGISGQIPTNIGTGYFYFGPIFAPIISIVFACFAVRASEKLYFEQNPYSKMLYAILAIRLSLGIIMYNFEITIAYLISELLPFFLMLKLSFSFTKKISIGT